MNNILKIIKDKKGSTAIMMTVVLMGGMLFISLTVGQIIANGIISGRAQIHSTKAFFAAESGIERILWETRQNDLLFEPPDSQIVDGAMPCGDDLNVGPDTEGRELCFLDANQLINGAWLPHVGFDAQCGDLPFWPCTFADSQLLSNNSSYQLFYEYDSSLVLPVKILSTGSYMNINRVVEVTY